MAADERKIVIELKAINSDDDDEVKKDDEEENKKRDRKIRSVTKQLISYSVRELSVQAEFYVNRYLTLTEDYKKSVLLDNIKTTVNKVKSLGEQMKNGIASGMAIGGAGGAVVGGIVGMAMFVGSTALELSRQYSEQNLELALNDRSAGYARSRLGLIDNGRGTYN